jgi:hypothetical protein
VHDCPPGGRKTARRLAALGLQHVLVMYAGAVAVPLIVGRALKLTPEQVAMLISADLFCCGLVTLIQSLGVTRWFGIRLPVMMGVTFAAVGPMVAMANAMPGVDGARAIFGAIIGAGALLDPRAGGQQAAALLSAGGHRHHHRHHRHQPDARGRGLGDGRAGAGWRRASDVPKLVAMVDGAKACRRGGRGPPGAGAGAAAGRGRCRWSTTRSYGALDNMAIAAACWSHPAAREVRQGLRRQHLGAAGHRGRLRGRHGDGQDELRQGGQGALVRRRHAVRLRHADLRPVMILTMTLVMIVVMIESTGMFLALSDITGKKIDQPALSAGLRTDGLGTLIGGIFNTFPYTSFSQNVGLVGVTGVRAAGSAWPAASS